MYRVWTLNDNHTVSVLTDWQSYGACQHTLVARWGHWPPWAFISRAKTTAAFLKANRIQL